MSLCVSEIRTSCASVASLVSCLSRSAVCNNLVFDVFGRLLEAQIYVRLKALVVFDGLALKMFDLFLDEGVHLGLGQLELLEKSLVHCFGLLVFRVDGLPKFTILFNDLCLCAIHFLEKCG